MDNTIPGPIAPPLPGSPASRPFGRAEPVRHRLPITFSGSGSEYFRIWIVNLLLTLVTLGLYFPWAKVRRLRYFYGNTSVGEYAFDFHGEPRRMLRGFLLVGAMALLYGLASKVSPISGLIALVIVAALWPALFRASQQFRMANTSWRGLRFRFNGDLAGAYRAMLPLFIPGLLTLAATLFARPPEDAAPAGKDGVGAVIVLVVALATMLLVPLFLWMLKKYQHGHYALGQVQTELRTSAGSFYAIALKTIGVSLLAGLAGGGVAMVIGGGGVLALLSGGGGKGAVGAATVFAIVIGIIAIYGCVILVVQPYVVSRMQNLVWGRTGSSQVRFESDLRFWPLLWLTLKNLLLTIVTLGLYWPFAKVAMARMRLQAVTLVTRLAPDDLVGSLRERADDAAGDAAGDLFGIDIGL
jgi:uncharacterized membrane protein YjgN (DUF898 family)